MAAEMIPEVSKEQYYIQATQDGIVRLDFQATDRNVCGLYTNMLETCIVIILVGDRGISLIHDTGVICRETIQKESEWIGTMRYWTTAFSTEWDKGQKIINKDYREKYPRGRFEYHRERLIGDVGIPGSHYHSPSKEELYYDAKMMSDTNGVSMRGCFAVKVDRNAALSIEQIIESVRFISSEEIQSAKVKLAPSYQFRDETNTLNNFFRAMKDGKKYVVEGDLQFDGSYFTESPSLIKSIEEMRDHLQTMSAETVTYQKISQTMSKYGDLKQAADEEEKQRYSIVLENFLSSSSFFQETNDIFDKVNGYEFS